MSAVLVHDAYGKSLVRLTKVTRHADRHELKELAVDIQLEGEFAAAYTAGDNSRLVATDTMKNTVYALAKGHPLRDIESFGQTLARHFLDNNAHVASARIHIVEHAWRRIEVQGRDHPHAFLGGGAEKRTMTVSLTRQGLHIESGIDDLLLLKTTDSAFRGFLRDRFTTLPETDDRIFATILKADWLYGPDAADWNDCHRTIRQALLETFAQHKSLGVQQTLFAMGVAALASCPQIEEIRIAMPNKHRLLVNLQVFGMENANEIFVATDEPHGLITGTMRRGQ
jgi:urate oxidase